MRRIRLTTICALITLSAAPAAGPPAPKPGYAIGHVLTAAGKPITTPDVKVVVALHGVSDKSGEGVDYKLGVRPDGSFEQRLVDGTYSFVVANVEAQLGDKTFIFDLAPVGDDKAVRESAKGIVQDYVWKLSGPRKAKASESVPRDWYGASVLLVFGSYRNDIRKSVPPPPAGAKCVFTLTPKGKLIDGGEGKRLTFTREYDPRPTGGLKNQYLPDVPVGVYMLTGEEVGPDGTKKPLLFWPKVGNVAESREVQFTPGATGADVLSLSFTRQ